MFKVEVRRPMPEDVEKLHRFFKEVLWDTYTKENLAHRVEDLERTIDEKKAFLEEDMASKGEKRYFLIAIDGDSIIGTAEYGPTGRTVMDCTKGELESIIEVGTIYVHPAYQGRGIGTLMLNMLCINLLGRGVKEFCIDSEFKNAQRVWKKKFGEPSYTIKDYWDKGHDHMVWRKRIKDLPINFWLK